MWSSLALNSQGYSFLSLPSAGFPGYIATPSLKTLCREIHFYAYRQAFWFRKWICASAFLSLPVQCSSFVLSDKSAFLLVRTHKHTSEPSDLCEACLRSEDLMVSCKYQVFNSFLVAHNLVFLKKFFFQLDKSLTV